MLGTGGSKRVWFVCIYVFIVLLVDTLAANGVRWHFDLGAIDFTIKWSVFSWRGDGALAQFDFFKFVFWLVVPAAICLPRMDWGYFGFARWKRADIYLLLGMVAIGIASVLSILYIPQLREWYPSASKHSSAVKISMLYQQFLWTASWLLGWEFMHRYFLLRAVAEKWPRWGWLLVPVSEALYHLQKDPIEMAAMFVAGIAFTVWTVTRKNLMLPLIVHGSVEVGLAAFLVIV
ncbi:MAG: CPBP family intramembrane metalloprotease [Candidatus Hydrogenedentes bacterium]|nr:CPBP family intramembrane metalloprotease [Candidatus Hydrogenedentota bacterium]